MFFIFLESSETDFDLVASKTGTILKDQWWHFGQFSKNCENKFDHFSKNWQIIFFWTLRIFYPNLATLKGSFHSWLGMTQDLQLDLYYMIYSCKICIYNYIWRKFIFKLEYWNISQHLWPYHLKFSSNYLKMNWKINYYWTMKWSVNIITGKYLEKHRCI